MNEDWGKGAKNNTIGWGQGACDNTIGWGTSQKENNSWSGETDISGCSTGLAQIDNVYSMSFDGTDDSVSIPQITIPRTSTISLWFNWADGVGLNMFLGGDTQNYFGLRNNVGFLKFFMDGFPFSPVNEILTNEPFNVNTWYHLVIVQTETPSVATCYINGVNKGNFNDGSRQLVVDKIGQWHTFLNQNFNGLIDEVAIFNVALTEQEVQSIYNATAVVDGVNKTADLSQLTTPPVGWYRMGD